MWRSTSGNKSPPDGAARDPHARRTNALRYQMHLCSVIMCSDVLLEYCIGGALDVFAGPQEQLRFDHARPEHISVANLNDCEHKRLTYVISNSENAAMRFYGMSLCIYRASVITNAAKSSLRHAGIGIAKTCMASLFNLSIVLDFTVASAPILLSCAHIIWCTTPARTVPRHKR